MPRNMTGHTAVRASMVVSEAYLVLEGELETVALDGELSLRLSLLPVGA